MKHATDQHWRSYLFRQKRRRRAYFEDKVKAPPYRRLRADLILHTLASLMMLTPAIIVLGLLILSL